MSWEPTTPALILHLLLLVGFVVQDEFQRLVARDHGAGERMVDARVGVPRRAGDPSEVQYSASLHTLAGSVGLGQSWIMPRPNYLLGCRGRSAVPGGVVPSVPSRTA